MTTALLNYQRLLRFYLLMLGPVKRKKSLQKAAILLRKLNRERVRKNLEPSGRPMAQRKHTLGGRRPVKIFLYENKSGHKTIHLLSAVSDPVHITRQADFSRKTYSGESYVRSPDGKYFIGWDIYSNDFRLFRFDRVV